MQNNRYVPVGKGGQLTLSGVTLLSAIDGGIPAGATCALIRVSVASIRWTDYGVDPSATTGVLMATTDIQPFEYWGKLSDFRMIPVTGSPVVDVAFYKGV